MQSNSPAYDRDRDHLRLLSIFHYVLGGIEIALSSIFIIHVIMGLVIFFNPDVFTPPNAANAPPPPPKEVGLLFVGMGSCVVFMGWVFGILTILSGRKISQRRARTFSLVVAGINCLWVPLGTALGVCTFIVLLRESVNKLYAEADAARGAAPA
jgi:hypothetical protein